MTTAVDCPHQEEAVRTCPGCKTIDSQSACEGEVEGSVIRDSEGDAGVINGIHYFTTVEDVIPTCGCTLTEKELDTVMEKMAERGSEPPDLSDDPQFPW